MSNNFSGKTFIKNNSNKTQELGFDFAKTLQKGTVICLYGELGSGKTTFTQGFAKGLGISSRIISPTFVIVRSYNLHLQNKILKCLYHIDLYRVKDEKSIENLGIGEILDNENNIVIIEWAEKLGKLLPHERVDIHFCFEENNARKIVFGSLNQ